jgi:hypothetical protein
MFPKRFLLFTVGNICPENSSPLRIGILYMIPKGIGQTSLQNPTHNVQKGNNKF